VSRADILLTGTSGVAREVLLGLLRGTPARIALLMPNRAVRPSLPRAAALFERLALDSTERARVDVVSGDVELPNLGIEADVRGRLADTLETIVHTASATTAGSGGPREADRGGTANALLLAERCFMAGRLQRFIHVNGSTEDRMVRAAMNAGLPVTIIDSGVKRTELVVSAVVRAAVGNNARCA
jgi:thioester reductase-like protein